MASSVVDRRRGAAWRIWDLHVHSPASLIQGYGGNTETIWAEFIDDLERLPDDIGVIGINDYWFLEGYKRVQQARAEGRIRNLDAVFPVVELRLDQFGGVDGDLSRVNMHVIFDPTLDASVIEAQFLNALQPKLRLSPEFLSLNWRGVITEESLTDLGRRIKETVPKERLHEYGSDLIEGFNNLNVSLSDIQAVLDGSFFKGKALLGIGKTEWADIKWNDQSIASKKNVINSADLVFTAYQDTSRWRKDVDSLRASNVTDRLLDCSDAHFFSNSGEYMRVGACQTWLNTVPTFAGLTYALAEFDRRIFVGLEPPALARVRKNPERFMAKIVVKADHDDPGLFDHDLPLNPGFVAVVGNKGQGKSALLDCIALAGNSSRNGEFAFLTPKRFLSAASRKRAMEYYAELEWVTGTTRRAHLPEGYDRSAPVSVEYLPQAFVERVCNIDPSTGDADEFEKELRAVLFTHIGEDERAGEKSFDTLLDQKSRISQGAIDHLRDELRRNIDSYIAIASFRARNQLDEIDGRLTLKQSEVSAAQAALENEQAALAEIDAASSNDGRLTTLKERSLAIEEARQTLFAQQAENERHQALLRQSLNEMEDVSQRAESLSSVAASLNDRAEAVMSGGRHAYVVLTVDRERYTEWRASTQAQLKVLQEDHAALVHELGVQDDARRANDEELATANSARERARQRVIQSEERVAALVGKEDDEESLNGLLYLRLRVEEAPDETDRRRELLIESSRLIHSALQAQLVAVESLYEPASRFIAQADVVKSAGLEFSADLRLLATWRDVPSGLDGRRNGDLIDWLTDLPRRLEDTSWEQLAPQLTEALLRLERERGDQDGPFRDPAGALRNTTTLDGLLMAMLDLSWLEVRFGLTGNGLPLSQLSPGQRGLVLALFYLVVDRRTTPLLLDQPEENLDNETIASKLVPAIHEASGRRQTIVVTHNANLAIVGDADQIIHCQLLNDRFEVSSGSIAELDVARFALDVLEGTKPAFDNRRHKYEAFPELN